MYMYSHWHTGRSDAVCAAPRRGSHSGGWHLGMHPLSDVRAERLQPAKSHRYTLWPSRRHARAGARSHEARCVTPDTTHPRSRDTRECRRVACADVSVRRVGADEFGRDVNAKGRARVGNPAHNSFPAPTPLLTTTSRAPSSSVRLTQEFPRVRGQVFGAFRVPRVLRRCARTASRDRHGRGGEGVA